MTAHLPHLLAHAESVVDPVDVKARIISGDLFERLVTTHGLTIEANGTHKFLQWRGVELAAELEQVAS